MDLAELLNEYIRSELIVVIPVLYFLGGSCAGLKFCVKGSLAFCWSYRWRSPLCTHFPSVMCPA